MNEFDNINYIIQMFSSQKALLCKASKVSMQYFVACNYFWLLVEAIFLHTLLFTAVLTKRRLLKRYMLVGWGRPSSNTKSVNDTIILGKKKG